MGQTDSLSTPGKVVRVSIPRSGLGTLLQRRFNLVSIFGRSPSHAVGSEQKKLYTFVSLFLDFLMSPSHIVGLKHLPKNLENPSLNPLKIKTAHR
jgi:hypothetical protein